VNHLALSGVDIYLFNFAINGDQLRPQHIKYLDDFFGDEMLFYVFQSNNMSWNATIHGEASRSGTDTYNLGLSNRRCESVRRYLLTPIVPKGGGFMPTKIRAVRIATDPRGEKLATSVGNEADWDRKVILRLQRRDPPIPPPLPPIGTRSGIRSIDPGVPFPSLPWKV
jgi:hypothetical protein